MAWYDIKEECLSPPCSEASKKLTHTEWNAFTTIVAPYASLTDKAGYLTRINSGETALEWWTPYTNILLADGTRELSANWDAGSHKITALQLESDATTGTAPLVVASTTKVTNFNADQVDGVDIPGACASVLSDHTKTTHDSLGLDHGSLSGKGDDDHTQYLLAAGTRGLSANWDAGSYKITALQLESDATTGTAPLVIASTTLVSNLNADQVDSCEAGVATGNVFKIPGSIAQGDIFYVDASGNIVRLAAGTSGYFLKTQGTGANPAWAALTGGGDFLADGSVSMTGNLDLGVHSMIRAVSITAYDIANSLLLGGGTSYPAQIQVYGEDVPTLGGRTYFRQPNAAKSAHVIGGYFEGVSDTPYLNLTYGLKVDHLSEFTATHGVAIDGLTIKDSGFALGSDAQGDIYYRNSSGGLSRLAPGTSGYFLKTQGASADPVWASIPGGGDMLKSTYDPDEDGLIAAAQMETDVMICSGANAMTGDLDMDGHSIADAYTLTLYNSSGGHYMAFQPQSSPYGFMLFKKSGGSYTYPAALASLQADLPIDGLMDGWMKVLNLVTGTLYADTVAEETATHGVAIDGLTIKDAGFALGSDADGDIYYRASGALARLAKGTAYQKLRMNSGATAPEYADDITSLTFVIDGGGEAITTGEKGHLEIPFGCTITQVTMLADQTGSIVVDIWKDTYTNYPPTDADSITSSTPPMISSAVKSQDSTLTSWTTAITAGDILAFNVDSCSTITRVTISIKAKKN